MLPVAKILILEDNFARQTAFRRKLVGNVVEIVETSEGALRMLQDETWDELYLDHDLGGQEFVESGPGTGYEVAVWLESHPEFKPGRIVLHSLNPAGRSRMAAALPEAEVIPWAWAW